MISKAESIALGLLIAVYAVAAYGEERVPEEGVLEEVIVFAQKREQPLLEVPISISTLSGEELEAAGIYSIDDISRLVPNLEVQTNVNSVQSTFRIGLIGIYTWAPGETLAGWVPYKNGPGLSQTAVSSTILSRVLHCFPQRIHCKGSNQTSHEYAKSPSRNATQAQSTME